MNPLLPAVTGFMAGVIVTGTGLISIVWKKVYIPYVKAQEQLNQTNLGMINHLQQYNYGLTETLEQVLTSTHQHKPSEITEEELSRGYV